MLTYLLKLFSKKQSIPEEYERMVRTEYRSVPLEFVEHFLKQNNRLPSTEELKSAL